MRGFTLRKLYIYMFVLGIPLTAACQRYWYWRWRCWRQGKQLGTSPTTQASDDEDWTKARVMTLERGQIQEIFNRSLVWAPGFWVVQCLAREEEGSLAGESNDFCLRHFALGGLRTTQACLCSQLANCRSGAPERGRDHLMSFPCHCFSHTFLLSLLKSY